MTNKVQEAYFRGFCKTAEANGVDPQALMKFATVPFKYLPKNLLSNAVRASSVAPQFAAQSRALPPYHRLKALLSRINLREKFLRDARNSVNLHYLNTPPESYLEAFSQAEDSLAGSFASRRLPEMLEQMDEIRAQNPDGSLAKALVGRV